jgi:rod shape-determining protein MreC
MQPVAHRDPALFRRGISPISKCLMGLSASALLLALDARQTGSGAIRVVLERLLVPVMVAMELPGEAAREIVRGLSTQGELLREASRLQAANDRLRAALRSTETLQRENDELRALAGLPTEHIGFRRTVELIQRGRGIASQLFLISAGSRQGIRSGMALVHPKGVIGQVVNVGENSSGVALITDAGQFTPVQLVRTGLRAVMVGEGEADRTSLRFLANNADVQPGDLLVTSGLDGVYPAGMAVATVRTVEREPQSDFARILCRPAADASTRRHFAVVVPLSVAAAQRPPGSAPSTQRPSADAAQPGSEPSLTLPAEGRTFR